MKVERKEVGEEKVEGERIVQGVTTRVGEGEGEREGWGWTRGQRVGLGVLVAMLAGVLVVQYVRRPFRAEDGVVIDGGERVTVAVRVDPNEAGVEELGRIPHVGEALARRIVAYREARKGAAGEVFRRAEDLDAVPGVGKRLVEEMRGFLRFPGEEGADGSGE